MDDPLTSSRLVPMICQLTAFALGAPPSLLTDIFDEESKSLVPLSPEERKKLGLKVKDVPEIGEGNWKDYLGVQESVPSCRLLLT